MRESLGPGIFPCPKVHHLRQARGTPIVSIAKVGKLSRRNAGTPWIGSHGTDMDISENRGTPKSSTLIGFSIINHPFWGTPIFGNPHIFTLHWRVDLYGFHVGNIYQATMDPMGYWFLASEILRSTWGMYFWIPCIYVCPAEKNTGGCINDGCDDTTFIYKVNFLQDCFHPQVSNGLHWYPSVVSEFIAKSIATTLRPASILDHYQEIRIPSKTHNTNLKMSGV